MLASPLSAFDDTIDSKPQRIKKLIKWLKCLNSLIKIPIDPLPPS